jgi:hypothetical protein
MVGQTSAAAEYSVQYLSPIVCPRVGASCPRVGDSKYSRYQLDVIASNIADVVQATAGLLFDRAVAGWDVNVLVAGDDDERPLQILGARRLDLHAEIASMVKNPRCATALVIAADMFAADEHVRREALSTLSCGRTEFALWGNACPAQLGGNVVAVQHRLSSAARAFKAHALAAAAVPTDSVGPTEELFIARDDVSSTLS